MLFVFPFTAFASLRTSWFASISVMDSAIFSWIASMEGLIRVTSVVISTRKESRSRCKAGIQVF